MRTEILAALAMTGCGRLGFESQPDATSLDATRCDELTGVLFCEDFEGTLQLRTTSATPPSFVVADDGTRSYRGVRALHARVTRPSEPAWILGAAMPYLMTGELHLRWYMYVPAEPEVLHLAPIHMVESSMPFDGTIVGIRGDVIDVTASTTGAVQLGAMPVPRGRWVCFQTRVVISDTAGSITVSIDGVEHVSMVGVDTLPLTGYRNIHAGSYATGYSTGTADLWIDELVASTSPIPCD